MNIARFLSIFLFLHLLTFVCLTNHEKNADLRRRKTNQASSAEATSSVNEKLIRLNVGGRVFLVERSILEQLIQLEEEMAYEKDESNAIKIDRNPEYFSAILTFLRKGSLELDNKLTLKDLRKEAEAYNLSELVLYCDEKINETQENVPVHLPRDERLSKAEQANEMLQKQVQPTKGELNKGLRRAISQKNLDEGYFYYFAYGSDLLTERMNYQVKGAEFVTAGMLPNYEIAFVGNSKNWGGAFATIEPKEGANVWGCVWRIPNSERGELDAHEGVQNKIYNPLEADIMIPHFSPDSDEEFDEEEIPDSTPIIKCHTYQVIRDNQLPEHQTPQLPSPHYKHVMVMGAKEHGLPSYYIKWLKKRIITNLDAGPVNINLKVLNGFFYYFAYGSNLLTERINTQLRGAEFETIGMLNGWELTFFGNSLRWKGAIASIVAKRGSHIWGCVWRVPNCFATELDVQEGSYHRLTVKIHVPDPDSTREGVYKIIRCRTYQFKIPNPEHKLPSPHYLQVIVSGAEEHNIPEYYLEKLKKIETNGYVGPVGFELEAIKHLNSKGGGK